MPWGAAIVAGGALLGASMSADAAGDAADTQADAANRATATGDAQFQQTRADQKPYREAGYGALSKLSDLLGLSENKGAEGYGSMAKPFTGASVATDPGYQFGLDQGRKAIDSSAAARGNLYSGATLQALNRFGNDYGTTKFNDAFNRDQAQNNSLANKLQSQAGLGQTSLGQTGQLGAQNAYQGGQNLIGAGNAQAAAGLAQGNAFAGAINQGASAYNTYRGNMANNYNGAAAAGAGNTNPYGGSWQSGGYGGGVDATAQLGW